MVSEEESQKSKKQATDKGKAVVNYPPVEHLLYPHALSKKDQERQYKCFLDIFKRLQIKIPSVEHLLYPHALSKKDKERQYKHFLDIFKRLQINIPFSKALEHMPTYAKFMKDLLTKKRRIMDDETVEVIGSPLLSNCRKPNHKKGVQLKRS